MIFIRRAYTWHASLTHLQTLVGRKLSLDLEPSATILTIKEMLQEKEGIEVKQIRLIYGGKLL